MLKHSDAEVSFGSFLIKRKIPQWRTISVRLETVSFPTNVLIFSVLFFNLCEVTHSEKLRNIHRKLLKREQ